MGDIVWGDGVIKQCIKNTKPHKIMSIGEIIEIINKIIKMEAGVENRTGTDFSKHELKVSKQDGVLIHWLKHPDYTHMYSVKFINTSGIMAVTGDYGNWIFCREFHPGKEGYVSGGYWIEKLHIASSQEGMEFDSEATEEEIQAGIDGGLEEYGYTGNELELMKDYYNELLENVEESQWVYESFAYSNMPNFLCAEDVPNVKKIKIWLQIVFDAFDEICNRVE